MAEDEKLEEQVKTALIALGLVEEDLVDAVECVVYLRDKLAPKLQELDEKKYPRTIIFASDQDAALVVDEITDRVVNRTGLLEKAMQGEDIHDQLERTKASVQSLIVGTEVQARTIEQLKATTQKMKRMERGKTE